MQRRRRKKSAPKNPFGTNPPSGRPPPSGRQPPPGKRGRSKIAPPPAVPGKAPKAPQKPSSISYKHGSLCSKYTPNCQEIKIDGETIWCLDRVYFDSGATSRLGREEKQIWIERVGGEMNPTNMKEFLQIHAKKMDVEKEHIFLLNPGSARLSEFRIWVTNLSMPREVNILRSVGEMKEIAEFPLDREKFVERKMSVIYLTGG